MTKTKTLHPGQKLFLQILEKTSPEHLRLSPNTRSRGASAAWETEIATGIRDYGEGGRANIAFDGGRVVLKATNEGGQAATYVDLLDVIEWVRQVAPELLKDR